jgi:hypothetical protein
VTLRTFYVLMGFATLWPAALFLLIFRSGGAPKWITRALRALAIILFTDGIRLVVVNIHGAVMFDLCPV